MRLLEAAPGVSALSGEGDNDAAVFIMGLIVGAAMCHNFGLASSTAGIGIHGALACIIAGFVVCLFHWIFFQLQREHKMATKIDTCGLSCPSPS